MKAYFTPINRLVCYF